MLLRLPWVPRCRQRRLASHRSDAAWFVNARGFESSKRAVYAGIRILGFLGAWIAAFAWFPTLPVAVVLAARGIYITPKVRWVGKEFQNVEPSSR